MNRLFHIQDGDRPAWVVAGNWQEALDKWRALIALENPGVDIEDFDPQGIELVCDSNELIVANCFESDVSVHLDKN